MYKATNSEYYLNYLGNNGHALGGTGWAMTEFGWDVKYAGVQTLVAKVKLLDIWPISDMTVFCRIHNLTYI